MHTVLGHSYYISWMTGSADSSRSPRYIFGVILTFINTCPDELKESINNIILTLNRAVT